MNTEGTGTRPTRILVICDNTAAAALTAAKLQKLAEAAGCEIVQGPTAEQMAELEQYRQMEKVPSFDPREALTLQEQPKKRGQYWKNDFDRTFGRRRK